MIRSRRVVASLLAGALFVAACGSDGDSDDGDDATEAVDDSDSGDDGAADSADDGADDSGDDGGDDAGDDSGDDGADDSGDDGGDDSGDDGGDDAGGDDSGDDAGAPADVTRGGRLVALLEAESDTWDIPGANCAVSCISVMNQVADTLMMVDENNVVQPFLLESFSVNDDFSEWTLVMREGVTFHDGTPADGAAMQRSLIEMASGTLQGQVFLDLLNGSPLLGGDPAESIVLADPNTVVVSFDKPFATFGYNLSGRTGWLIAPSFWDDPERASALMIGTGPFQMVDQVRDEVTVLDANPDYWRTDGNGEALPYLDGIDFRPNPDVQARRAAMEAGDAHVNLDSFGENREFWNGDWVAAGNSVAPRGPDRETTYLMFNNSKPPFDNPDTRRALALCTDRDLYLQLRAPGDDIANGPFAEGAAGFMEDPGFPQFDAEAGNARFDEIGRPDVINYGTTNVPSNLLTAELFAQMWSDNCGLNVNIDQFDQSELITRAITGDFETFLWRNHGQGNPGLEFVWWHSRHSEGLARNFGRIVDPAMDELLFQTWATDDPAELDAIGQQMNQLFAENVYNLWLNVNQWNNPVAADTFGVNVVTLAGETRTVGLNAGRLFLHEAWIQS